ncbi:hypothetical protein L209DRAFT_728319 [Thermothelomyces heterothallicus CBS 203.75]
MRRCSLFHRLHPGPERHNAGGVVCDGDTTSEKPDSVRRQRDWSAVFLTFIRFLQFAYFAGLYVSLHHLQWSSYFWDDSPWQRSPDQRRNSWRLLRWLRMQASVTLMYHAGALVVPWLLRLLRATRRPFTSLATVFGDGWALMALLNTLVMLDSTHEEYCHGPLQGGVDFDLRNVFNSRSRTACKSLDLVFGFGGLVIVSHLVTAIATGWRAKRSLPAAHAKVEPPSDIEQGVTQRPSREEPSRPATPHREHSPPPSYHSAIVTETSPDNQDYAVRVSTQSSRGRSSMETTSSLGIERYGYLVSDGWRAPEQPPVYSSRPPSLHNAAI